MMSAKDVHGELYKIAGIFILSSVSFLMSFYIPAGSLADFLGIRTIPCLGLAIFSGLLYVFWISIGREVYGKGYGTLVSLITVSLLLLNEPWYGVVDPPYFGVFGFLSFLFMGLVTDYFNGGFGSLACVAVNWIASSLLAEYPQPLWLAFIVLALSFVSGFFFDLLAKFTTKRIFARN